MGIRDWGFVKAGRACSDESQIYALPAVGIGCAGFAKAGHPPLRIPNPDSRLPAVRTEWNDGPKH
ncbi:conserved hypothetical protein [Xanthomonas citri pv. fuscans]|nr:conserved hypothetical protein [Xanthomonas citri pv. fuscans]